ncbi:response regulator transcription factor [Alloacidobacterium sp.]|uniref:response regulator transcription factor n=1 Tax=Alloacidobacterium sp. TaxID=2951999 RepID=UPI002D48DE46|nr:response regulator transcription factor [Alloacidobacterium sp.]HYK34546.1 response regulator transcription factor [Alloacidobacterium sp.]
MRLLIAEDDRALQVLLRKAMEADGHRVMVAGDGQTAADIFASDAPDLIILDLNLPRKDGAEVLKFIRSINDEIPILILTARIELDTKVRCLDMGADDCMQKPFSLRELRARCRALTRRKRETGLVLRYADLELDRINRSVKRDGVAVVLTNREFALLECLLQGRGQSISRTDLLERVWEAKTSANTNIVDVYVNYLRRKLNDTGANPLIQTVRGQGYAIARLNMTEKGDLEW